LTRGKEGKRSTTGDREGRWDMGEEKRKLKSEGRQGEEREYGRISEEIT
jgi:hypothetical protein